MFRTMHGSVQNSQQIIHCYMRPDLQKADIIPYLIFREIPLLNIQTNVAS